ncbi:MAG: uroporphyrinogen decarboxylase [Planctomycetes bacterium]|nr:uroporphyrinogen decarboxylase [Planctomycetota bacterium]
MKSGALYNSPFLRACRREKADYTPIWLMRQAGRYQREYREIREKVSFLELCKTPELAAQVTVMAVEQLNVDAAIIFADILLIVEPMGVGLAFNKGEGPSIARPVRSGADVDQLNEVDVNESLSFVFEAVRITRRELAPGVPLIGFCGAPFTVASYMIEGGAGREFAQTRSLMHDDPGAWNALLERIARASAGYVNGQIAAGAQAVQVFDSWVGCLDEQEYRRFVLPHTQSLIRSISPGTPVIHFAPQSPAKRGHSTFSEKVECPLFLRAVREAGGDVIGLDWRVNLAEAWESIGYDVGVQGNLDPNVLLTSADEIRRQAKIILNQAAGRPGHIFNLGHGVLPNTPVDNARALVDAVHEYTGSC